MNKESLAEKVPARWREAFLRFIDTGEAEDEFLDYLDNDPVCQAAVEEAFTAQAAAFEQLAGILNGSAEEQELGAYNLSDLLSDELARTIRATVEQLPDSELHAVAEKTAASIAEMAQEAQRMKKLVAELDEEVAGID